MSLKRMIVAGGSALLLACSLVACTGGANSSGASGQTTSSAAASLSTDAKVEPDLIEPGWLEGDNTSDLWWKDGAQGQGESLYFTHAANDAGMDATFVDADGTENNVWDLERKNGHLVTLASATDKRKVDFTFQDNFTCYDAVSGTHYTRGDRTQDEYNALFAGKAFVQENDPERLQVAFNEDGTCSQTLSKKAITGTYEVVSTNIVRCFFEDWSKDFRFTLEGNAVASIAESANVVLVQQ